jgi:hypothetical protein
MALSGTSFADPYRMLSHDIPTVKQAAAVLKRSTIPHDMPLKLFASPVPGGYEQED